MGQGRNRNSDLSDGEWAILKVVWERQPLTAPDVREALLRSRGWAYSTVRTMMDRLVKKGVLQAEKVRNLTLYRALLDREEASRQETGRTLRRVFDGALGPMVECLLDDPGLTPAELERIERMLRRRRRKRQGRGKKEE